MTTRKGTSGQTGQTGRRGRSKSADDGVQAELPDLVADRRLLEQELMAMSNSLSQHDFASIEEANAFLQQLLERGDGLLPRTEPTTVLEEAQEVVYQALQAPAAQRTALARQALTISPDCADAYVLLAEAATDPQEACHLYEQGVAAGERALGEETFREESGHFWGLVETRPYMRAREGLAHVLWHLEERAGLLSTRRRCSTSTRAITRESATYWRAGCWRSEMKKPWSSYSDSILTSGARTGATRRPCWPSVGRVPVGRPTPRSSARSRSIPTCPSIYWGSPRSLGSCLPPTGWVTSGRRCCMSPRPPNPGWRRLAQRSGSQRSCCARQLRPSPRSPWPARLHLGRPGG